MEAKKFSGNAGMPKDLMIKKLEPRIIPNLRGYDGTYKGVMNDMKSTQAGLKKAFKAGNSF